jgi:penicillin-binding protein 1C
LALYKDESLPEKTYSFTQEALHLLQYLSRLYPDKYIFESTLHYSQQLALNKLLEKEAEYLQADDINNIAAIIIDVNTNELISYVGNINSKSGAFRYVDIVQSPRSYGSILKPLLYAYALEYGHALPYELIPDIPTHIGEFHPENFDKKYRGAVPLDEMIIQSLNVPAVRLLNKVGLESFYNEIEKLQIAALNKGADHYGLSLILGGGESTLWDLCRVYKGLARNKLEFKNPYNSVNILKDGYTNQELIDVNYNAEALTYLVDAMADVNRPREEKSWTKYNQDYKIAWKTGTSYGHKDAWAMGFNSKYMIGVWVGNENGEGRFNLTGVTKAAPIMFKAFNSLNDNKWFDTKISSKNKITVCLESGKMAGNLCKKTHQIDFQSSHKLSQCSYHIVVNLDEEQKLISEDCNKKIFDTDTVFVLPASMEYYYRKEHISYINIPALADNCTSKNNRIDIIYPDNGVKIFLPKEGVDHKNELVSKAYHSSNNATLFWFIDDKYIATTNGRIHENVIKSEVGVHKLSVIDQDGNKESITFELLAAN